MKSSNLLTWLLWLALLLPGIPFANAADLSAHGFIVKLKATNAAIASTQKDPTGVPTLTAAQRQARALATVLRETGFRGQIDRPLGNGAQLIGTQSIYTAAQAKVEAQRLRSHPAVEYVVPNVLERRAGFSGTPNDSQYAQQWWLQNATSAGKSGYGLPGVSSAWVRSVGEPVSGASVVIAVLDSGLQRQGEMNSERMLAGYDFVKNSVRANDGNGRDNDSADPGDWVDANDLAAYSEIFGKDPKNPCNVEHSSWHGTTIAAILAAPSNNGQGVASVNWAGRVLPVRVAGKCGAEIADIVDGMLWAVGLRACAQADSSGVCQAYVPDNPSPARILNLSLGNNVSCDTADTDADAAATAKLYQETISVLKARGALLIAAAGNERVGAMRPASCPDVISVGALNRDGFKATYSNWGGKISLATVGGDIGGACGAVLGKDNLDDGGLVTIGNNGKTGPGDAALIGAMGSSFSAPIVAGVASLMLAVNPNLSFQELHDGLIKTTRPHILVPKLGDCAKGNEGRCQCTTSTCGAGILDAAQALTYAQSPMAWVKPIVSTPTLDNAAISACDVALHGAPPPEPAASSPTPSSSTGGGALDGIIVLLILTAAIGLVALSNRHKRC